ncbi:MAG TPA: Gfo/Idh/MocA family oxidoreductase [Mycobacteriales bacterium]|nr:Gfo/Idh/MocA family oxidoreductase [Mycobacteriales bacterium]
MTAPVRWGFLGAGWIATRALAPAVHGAAGAELYAVAARDLDRARGLHPRGPVFGSYDALLADPDVDAVYISLTNDVHAEWSIAALRAGKHVLCEKPLAMNSGEVDAMTAAAAASGRLLVEASWYRWHPRVRAAQELLSAGAIGAVHHVNAGFVFAGELTGNYRLEVARGGGALYDVGCYAVSAAQWAFGGAPVREVVARQQLGPSGVDVVTEAVLSFDAGEAQIRAGISEPPRQWLVISGDDGELELRDAAYTSWVEDETLLLVSDGSTTERRAFPPTDPYRVMVEEMSSVMTGGAGWLLPLAQSRATAAVLDACFASARGGGTAVAVGAGA